MATRAPETTPTSRLEVARQKFHTIERIDRLRRDNYIEESDVEHIPSHIPTNSEEFTAFMQQLFQYGLRKWMPGCPVRVNANVLSLRLDGVQYRKAKEIRALFEKNGIRNYISDKNRNLFELIERHNGEHLRSSNYTEYKEEQDRQFLHLQYQHQNVNYSGMQSIYQSIVLQGRSDAALSAEYDTITALVQERNEVRRREFIQNRTNLNAQFIQHAVGALTIPIEYLQNAELESALREAGVTAFIKKPVIQDLVSTDVMVDVFSAPDEEDESWRIMPVTPEIVESDATRIYHGQGTITAYDPDSQAAKNGTLPYVIQHCLRAGANVDDFVAVLPEDFRANLEKSNEIYERIVGQSSEGLNKGNLARAYTESQRAVREQEAQQAILETPVSQSAAQAQVPTTGERPDVPDIDLDVTPGLATEELDRIIAEAFGRPVPEQEAVREAQSSVVDTLTQQLMAQMQQGERRTVPIEYVPAEPEDDDLPFEQEPAAEEVVEVVAETPAPSIDELYASMMAQLATGQAPTPTPEHNGSYHECYGANPIFVQAGEGNVIESYIAFRGQEGRQFTNFNEACIYSGKPVGQVIMHNYLNRSRQYDADAVVWIAQFDGSLF